jgi:hypothetical protein
MRKCELWVVGSVWYLGTTYPGYTRMIAGVWNESTPLPPISFNSKPAVDYDYYNDGLGGIFSGSGWVGSPSYYLKNCVAGATDPDQPCDCVNGGCVPKTTYNTPGVFPNFAACESGCAKNSNCTGECVDPAEIAALGQALTNLQAKICK